MRLALRDISIRVKMAALAAAAIAVVVLGQSFQTLVNEAVATQEEIALETRLTLVSLAGAVGSLWTEERVPDLAAFAERFGRRHELRSLALLSPGGEVIAHHGILPTPQEIRMVTRLRLRTVPRTLWGLGTGPVELVIATPILRGDSVRGHLLAAVRTLEPATRLRGLVWKSVLQALMWTALGAGLTLWATRRLTHPLEQLAEDLQHLGRGPYHMPSEGRAGGEIGVVQDRLVELADMLAHERAQVAELTGALNHQINDISAGLEARAAELSAVLDSARDAVLVVRLDGRVSRVNEPAQLFFGDTSRGPLWDRVEDPKALQRAVERAHAMQRPTLVHTRVRSGEGEEGRHLRIRIAPLRRGEHARDALILVAEDESASRQLIDHMMRSERLASMSTLTAGMAHQLGNHLNAITGYAGLLARQMRGGGARVENDLAAISREVRAAGELLERTQELARTRHATNLTFGLAQILNDVRDMTSLAASRQSVEMVVDVPADEIPLQGDPGLLGEALRNLVMNGIQAMPGGGTLTLHASQRDGSAIVAVQDTGEGIPEDAQSHIFDPFFTTKAAGEGTGLGLAIAHRIVELHGGEIDFSSRPGEGTIFVIQLPLRREGLPPPGDAGATDPSNTGAPS